MQYSWLEKLAEQGHVRPQALEKIYRDCSLLVEKNAGLMDSVTKVFKKKPVPVATGSKFNQFLHKVVGIDPAKNMTTRDLLVGFTGSAIETARDNPVGALGGGYAAYQIGKSMLSPAITSISNLMDRQRALAIRSKIEKAVPEQYRDKATARYDELVSYSLQAALNEPLAAKLVAQRLHSGFTSEDAQRLSLVQGVSGKGPQESPVKSYLKKVTKLGSVSNEKVGEILADVIQLQKEAGVYDFTKSAGAKWDLTKQLLKSMAVVGATGLAAGAVAGTANVVSGALSARKLKDKLDESFKEALKRSDPNRESLMANKDKARQAFETLVHFAPHVAAEPSAARAFMNSMVSHDLGVHISSVKELSEIERNLKTTGGANPFLEGMRSGSELFGVSRVLGKVTEEAASPFVEEFRFGVNQLKQRNRGET